MENLLPIEPLVATVNALKKTFMVCSNKDFNFKSHQRMLRIVFFLLLQSTHIYTSLEQDTKKNVHEYFGTNSKYFIHRRRSQLLGNDLVPCLLFVPPEKILHNLQRHQTKANRTSVVVFVLQLPGAPPYHWSPYVMVGLHAYLPVSINTHSRRFLASICGRFFCN